MFRMDATTHHPRLIAESCDIMGPVVALQQIGTDKLDRDETFDVRVDRLIHHAHRAPAEQALDRGICQWFPGASPSVALSLQQTQRRDQAAAHPVE